jgi:hypothetical protein
MRITNPIKSKSLKLYMNLPAHKISDTRFRRTNILACLTHRLNIHLTASGMSLCPVDSSTLGASIYEPSCALTVVARGRKAQSMSVTSLNLAHTETREIKSDPGTYRLCYMTKFPGYY